MSIRSAARGDGRHQGVPPANAKGSLLRHSIADPPRLRPPYHILEIYSIRIDLLLYVYVHYLSRGTTTY